MKQGDIVNILRDRLPIVDDVELRQELLLATDEIIQLRRRLAMTEPAISHLDSPVSNVSTTPEALVSTSTKRLLSRVLSLHEQCLADKGKIVDNMRDITADRREALKELRLSVFQQVIGDAGGTVFATEEGKEFLRNCQALFKRLNVRVACHQCKMPATLSFGRVADYQTLRWRFSHGKSAYHKVLGPTNQLITSVAEFPNGLKLVEAS